MVLLQKIVESAIVENLKKRFMDDCIYVRHLIVNLPVFIYSIKLVFYLTTLCRCGVCHGNSICPFGFCFDWLYLHCNTFVEISLFSVV